MTSIRVARDVVEQIIDHARADAPRECCGFLVGTSAEIEDRLPMRNIAGGESRFHIDPKDHIELNRSLRGSGRQIVGVYHSHPRSAATPSPSDITDAHYPDFVHVIVSLAEADRPVVRAFSIRDGGAIELRLDVRPEE